MNEVQRRYLSRAGQPVRLEQRSDGALPVITGYAAVFYRDGDPSTEYEMWGADGWGGRVVERIMPGAFARALREDDPRALFNHDSALVLGRKAAGTLRLTVDAIGLRYEIDPPDTQTARDLLASLRRGDITGSSFAFIPKQTEYRDTTENGKVVETVVERHDVELFDVGPVTFPAYSGASAGVRGAGDLDAVRAEIGRRRARADRALVDLAWLLASVDDDV